MKINPVVVVVAILAIGAAAYYLHHHQINVNVDIKGDNGSKSRMSVKHDQPKHDKHVDDDNA
ncbi:MAG: hypothetical protein Q8Q60_02505 [Candidatus Chromulinivorax sp.]|nr:hypothetical protein [Candidatus Chromulinivorax sp.]